MLNKVLIVFISINILLACSPRHEDESLLYVSVEHTKPIVEEELQYYNDQLRQHSTDNIRHAVSQIWGGKYLDAQKSISLVEKRKEKDRVLFDVVFIFDNVPDDDSISSYRYDIQLKEDNSKFEILKLEESWRCWSDRGHRYFSVGPCK